MRAHHIVSLHLGHRVALYATSAAAPPDGDGASDDESKDGAEERDEAHGEDSDDDASEGSGDEDE